MPRLASLLGSMALGAALFAPPELTGEFGLASAAAAPAKAARKKASVRKNVKAAPVAASATPAAQPATSGRRVKFVEKKSFAVKARYASLPKFKPKVVLKQAPAAPQPAEAAVKPPEAPPVAAAVVPVAASAKAELPPDRVIATASIAPVPVVHPGAERMRSALEARARSLASEQSLAAIPLPEAAPLPELSARRVTFDLEKGERTVVFEDGASATAPFDKARASDLTGLRPTSR